jgi:hypothetical protein
MFFTFVVYAVVFGFFNLFHIGLNLFAGSMHFFILELQGLAEQIDWFK